MSSLFKPLFKELFKEPETGKQHSLRYDESYPDFAKWLRLNYYYVEMFNQDVNDLKIGFDNK